MSALLDQVRAASEALSSEEKRRFALELLESCADALDPVEDARVVDAEWAREVAKRIGEIEAGQVELSPWESVKAVAEASGKWPKP